MKGVLYVSTAGLVTASALLLAMKLKIWRKEKFDSLFSHKPILLWMLFPKCLGFV